MQRGSGAFRFWLTVLGVVILIAGLATAYQIRMAASQAYGGGIAYATPGDETKQYADGLQKYGGNMAVIVAAYKRKLHNLVQVENLAWLLAIVAVLLAATCFRLAWSSTQCD